MRKVETEPRILLFNLDDDPGEQHDLAGKDPDTLARMTRLLEQVEASLEEGDYPLRLQEGADTVKFDAAARKMLEELGYLEEKSEEK